MAGKKTPQQHHVVPHPEGWAVIRAGGEKPSHVLPTKKEATDAGRQISQNQQTELIIHGTDGKIQKRDSHGHDPHPPQN